MNISTNSLYVQLIANKVADYQGGGIMTPERILQWINQFDPEDHEVILSEMASILQKNYVSKDDAKQYLVSFFNVNQQEHVVKDFELNYKKVQFLNIQEGGQSQRELLELLDEVLLEQYGFVTEDCGTSNNVDTYIYIDDCFFTGKKVSDDIKKWVEKANPRTTLHIIFFGVHSADYEFRHNQLKGYLSGKNIELKVSQFKKIIMDKYAKGTYECCWPAYHSTPEVDSFLENLNEWRSERNYGKFSLFRDANKPYTETLFSSMEARNKVEQAFLKKGIHIFNLSENPNKKFMPMGYNLSLNLGFGSIFVTYRNVPNNCPLVLWWGDPNKNYPINQWLPLFPRSTYE
ncbi:hypothetical protein SAMN05720606_10619 [Paenibacillus polysaccharolyticus]|uniref:PRTase-CE domain-containing protein n=1 Tax=Paenibacillus polysaccharolyticus TaxID=582692 RepID=A0A1G5GSA2_9BACL|nr:hypothetical protein [Paenibacillus polysaccharolyticus]SCY54426.1 hypothetical protein SAMN05720606_10619 [Paenibacillus polysaccharolyticus]